MAKSAAFAADLPDMSAEQLAKLYAWGKSSCVKFDVQQMDNGTMLLVAVRKKPGTAREHQRLLRTSLLNWKVELPPRQANWLRLLDEAGEAESAQPEAPATTSPHQESTPELEEPVERENVDTAYTLDTVPPAPLIRPSAASMPTAFELELPKNLLTPRFAELACAAQIAAH